MRLLLALFISFLLVLVTALEVVHLVPLLPRMVLRSLSRCCCRLCITRPHQHNVQGISNRNDSTKEMKPWDTLH